jgi:Photosynthetic reaction centre cytochrome C subunit
MKAMKAIIVAVWPLVALIPRTAQGQVERTAEQTYKNIQVFKGVPASQFMNTMFFQRYALGVGCGFCHIGGDFAKDDKPTKVKARQMIQMVRDINARNFDGKVKVTCMTCHRGTTTPQVDIASRRFSIQEMIDPRPPASVRKPANVVTTVDSLLANYIAALGGQANLSKITSRMTTGSLIQSEGLVVPFEQAYESSPSRWVSVRHFGPRIGDFSTGYDGTTAWNKDNRGTSVQDGERRGEAMMNAQFWNGLWLRDLYSNLALDTTTQAASPGFAVLVGVAKLTGKRERLYFDTATGLLARRSIISQSVFGTMTTDVYYESYESHDGVQIPTLVSEFTPDFGIVYDIMSIDHKTSIPAAMFMKPDKP